MQVLLKEVDGVSVGKEWQGAGGKGYVILSATPGGTIVSFTKTVTTAGTAIQLSVTSVPCRKVYIQATTGSGVIMQVGDVDVDAADGAEQGVQLVPGNPHVEIEVDDLNKLYIDAKTNGGKVCGFYLT